MTTALVAPPSVDLHQQLRLAREELLRRVTLKSFRNFLPYWKFVDTETGEVCSFSDEELWEGQQEFVEAARLHDWLLALKAGKLGFTELECSFDAYRALGAKNARVHIFSRVGQAAQEHLDKVKFGLNHLPDWLRPRYLKEQAGGETASSLKWRVNKDDTRTVVSYTASPNASIEQTAIHAHVDELARMAFAEKTWQAINSTVAPGGTCHVISRGAGDDNYLKVLWDSAEGGSNEFYPLFCNWRKRPGRDEVWLAIQAGKMTLAGLKYFAPETAEDALSGEDTTTFVPLELWQRCKEDLPPFDPGTNEPVVLALDAAVSGDCFAVDAITRHPAPGRHLDPAIRAVRIWAPPKGGKIDYRDPESFIRCLITGGCAAGHSQDERFRREDCEACQSQILVPGYNVVAIVYDPFQLHDMTQRLNRELGVYCISFDQGKLRLVADRMLYDLIVQRRLAHSGSDIMEEHIKNAAARVVKGEDSKMRIVKKAQDKKVDAVVAASMGVHECLRLTL